MPPMLCHTTLPVSMSLRVNITSPETVSTRSGIGGACW